MKSPTSYDPPLDEGIAPFVHVLVESGVETFESCEGGPGHAYPVPTVRFHGYREEGMRALAAALAAGLPVAGLRRVWDVIDGEPTGPHWELTFTDTTPPERSLASAPVDQPGALLAKGLTAGPSP